MFLPIHDQIGLKYIRRAYVNYTLIIANILVWIVLRRETVLDQNTVQMALGFIPGVIFNGDRLDPTIALVPSWATFITYAFFHIDFMHIAVNLLFLFVFGDNVEDALGHVRYALFYLACAAFGALIHGLTDPTSQIPLIGASGAISGVISAYVLLHPRVRVWVLVLFGIPLPLPAFVPLLLWIGEQFYMLATDPGGMVSWGAHTGGIVAGAILVIILKRPGVALLDRKTPSIERRPG
ncbi:Membrane associated serine protease, rhomboid family [Ensifer adhaerens]|nr:Membrane associated serine protease, rhomboid family [Ensifer adhaerens]